MGVAGNLAEEVRVKMCRVQSEVTWGGCRSYSPSHIPDVCTFPPGGRHMPFAGRCGISSSDLPTCPALGFTPAPAVGKGGKGGETKLTREPSFFQSHSASLCLWNVKKYGDPGWQIPRSTSPW